MSWRQRRSTWMGVAAGAIGGAVASFVMEQFQTRLGGPSNLDDRANAEIATAVIGPTKWGGGLVHYAYGIGSGALYGAIAEHWDDARAGQGSAFGAALWALSDGVAVPALHLAKGPRQHPWCAHGVSFAAHLLYGVTVEWTRRLVRSGALSR